MSWLQEEVLKRDKIRANIENFYFWMKFSIWWSKKASTNIGFSAPAIAYFQLIFAIFRRTIWEQEKVLKWDKIYKNFKNFCI